MRSIRFVAVLALALLASSALAQQTVLHLQSDPGDYIGIGQTKTLTAADFDFYVSRNYQNGVSFAVNSFGRPNPNYYVWWYGDFSAPFTQPIAVGSYENATRFPFNAITAPGLSIYGEGRGCNMSIGRFDVREAVFDPQTGAVVSFAVDFEQHCEFSSAALFGYFRYNSSVPIPVLIPPRVTLLNPLNAAGCVEATGPAGATLSFDGSSSVTPVSFRWSSSTGASGSGTSFSFPLGVNQTADVALEIEDPASGERATTRRQVCVSDTTPPDVVIVAPSGGQTFVGENGQLVVRVTDLVDTIADYKVSISEMATLPLDPSGAGVFRFFRKPSGQAVPVEIRVEAQDASGNQGSSAVTVYRAHDRS